MFNECVCSCIYFFIEGIFLFFIDFCKNFRCVFIVFLRGVKVGYGFEFLLS